MRFRLLNLPFELWNSWNSWTTSTPKGGFENELIRQFKFNQMFACFFHRFKEIFFGFIVEWYRIGIQARHWVDISCYVDDALIVSRRLNRWMYPLGPCVCRVTIQVSRCTLRPPVRLHLQFPCPFQRLGLQRAWRSQSRGQSHRGKLPSTPWLGLSTNTSVRPVI